MKNTFIIWKFDDVPKSYVPKTLLNVQDKEAYIMGTPFADAIPNDLQFSGNPDYPNDLIMLDSIGNTESVIPISEKLKNASLKIKLLLI